MCENKRNENIKHSFVTIVDAIAAVHENGFTLDFYILNNKLFCPQSKSFFKAEDFAILEIYAFDAECGLSQENMIYAIECFAERMKGILLQTCGRENDNSHNLLNKKIRKFWEQKFG